MDRIRQLQTARNTSLRAMFNLFVEWYNLDKPSESLSDYVTREAQCNLSYAEANIVIDYLFEGK